MKLIGGRTYFLNNSNGEPIGYTAETSPDGETLTTMDGRIYDYNNVSSSYDLRPEFLEPEEEWGFIHFTAELGFMDARGGPQGATSITSGRWAY